MKPCLTLVFAAAALACPVAFAAADPADVSCSDPFFKCLKGEDLRQQLTGKTIRYKHPRPQEFGYVTATFRSNGWLNVGNSKGTSHGTWEIVNDSIVWKAGAWGEGTFKFVRIGDRLFVQPASSLEAEWLTPVAIQE